MNAEEKAKKVLDDLAKVGAEQKKLLAESGFIGKIKSFLATSKFWYQITSTAMFIFRNFIWPFYSWAAWLFGIIFWKHFRRAWDRFAYKMTPAGERKFSPVYGSVMFATTAAILFVVYHLLFIAFDAGLYVTTAKVNEQVYMSNAQEISAETNLHSAQGCITNSDSDTFSCGPEDSLYFRVESSIFNQLWSLAHHGTFFYPDYVAAAIAPGWTKCTITSYGIRVKFFMRSWDIYPRLLEANCTK